MFHKNIFVNSITNNEKCDWNVFSHSTRYFVVQDTSSYVWGYKSGLFWWDVKALLSFDVAKTYYVYIFPGMFVLKIRDILTRCKYISGCVCGDKNRYFFLTKHDLFPTLNCDDPWARPSLLEPCGQGRVSAGISIFSMKKWKEQLGCVLYIPQTIYYRKQSAGSLGCQWFPFSKGFLEPCQLITKGSPSTHKRLKITVVDVAVRRKCTANNEKNMWTSSSHSGSFLKWYIKKEIW